MGSAVEIFAPVPDFRSVVLEPIFATQAKVVATAFGLGAGVVIAMSNLDPRSALVAGAAASIVSALALRGAGAGPKVVTSGSARMAIVPWGVLVDADGSPRILRWAGVRRIEVAPRKRIPSGFSTRVAVETAHDRFVGEACGTPPLAHLAENVDAYAREQSTPLALDLGGVRAAEPIEATEPGCEALLDGAQGWLESASAATDLALPSAGYRRASARAASDVSVAVLGRILRDRRPKAADPRAFAAVIAAELGALPLLRDLVALCLCPHPIVAAVARQAARKLGASAKETGTLDEIAPFLWDGDRARLQAWCRT